MNIEIFTANQFNNEVASQEVLVKFYKDKCPACQMLDASLRQTGKRPMVLSVRLEVLGEQFFRDFGLRQVPALLWFRGGIEVGRISGYQTPSQLLAWYDSKRKECAG